MAAKKTTTAKAPAKKAPAAKSAATKAKATATKSKAAPAKATTRKPAKTKAPAKNATAKSAKAPATRKAASKPAAKKVVAKTSSTAGAKAAKPTTKAAAARKPAQKTAPAKSASKPAAAKAKTVVAAKTAKAPVKKSSAAAQAPAASAKPTQQRGSFRVNEHIVYPAHGVGKIMAIETQEIAGISLELFVINFTQEKMTLRVPTTKATDVGMRKLSDEATIKKALKVLQGRARIKRTMWSRRAQEYDAKINSGSIIQIAEVVRDLYRAETQPEQSYSERQLYEAALDRLAREVAAVEKLDEQNAVQKVTEVLSRTAKAARKAAEEAAEDGEEEEAA